MLQQGVATEEYRKIKRPFPPTARPPCRLPCTTGCRPWPKPLRKKRSIL